MARWTHKTLTCPGCGQDFTARVVDGLNLSGNPEMIDALVAGVLHAFRCPGCGDAMAYEKPSVYLDLPRLQFVMVEPRTELEGWRAAGTRVGELFRLHCIEEPGALRDEDELAAFKVRAVFGLDRLREKVIVWREGLAFASGAGASANVSTG